ncbi:unnamed protein product [Prunus brigantina]
MDPILQFLQNQTLPADPAEARRVRYRSARYLILNGALYKRGFSLPYLRCLTPEEGNYVLKEIHEGICGTTITAARIETFVWQNIVCRFGIPNIIVTDNGRQFDNAKFKQFCSNLKIKLCFASPAHPQSNGQPTYRTSTYEAEANDEQLALNLDFIDELRDQSNMRNVAYKQRIAKYYDSRVKPRAFKVGDWVMRKVSLATKNPTEGTLGPTWEGPYEVTGISRPAPINFVIPRARPCLVLGMPIT